MGALLSSEAPGGGRAEPSAKESRRDAAAARRHDTVSGYAGMSPGQCKVRDEQLSSHPAAADSSIHMTDTQGQWETKDHDRD